MGDFLNYTLLPKGKVNGFLKNFATREKCQMYLFIFTLKNGMKKTGSRGGVWGFVTCIYFGHKHWLGGDL